MKRTTIDCPNCDKQISKSNYTKHVNSKQCLLNQTEKSSTQINEDWKQSDGTYKCPHCDKSYSKNGISTHIWRTHGEGKDFTANNENYIVGSRTAWNKGLTKETDDRVRTNAENTSKTFQQQLTDGTYKGGGPMGLEARKRLSERQSLHNSGGKCKWFEVNGQMLQGTWERDCALQFEQYSVSWKKITKDPYSYTINEAQKSYTPDLFLSELNIILEIKGFWWGDDEEKMKRVLESNPELGNKIYFVFKKDFNMINSCNNKDDLLIVLKGLKSLEDYFN